jgi:2-polyprenyl-3-methyl-5-hydroxy-6-metoxy-1,4-benzoquinol methylase
MSNWDPTSYDQAWTDMAAAGKDPHGEVAFVQRLLARHNFTSSPSILDAGCGTGRVAVEFALRGFQVEGTDVDSDMLGEARAKNSALTWTLANLADLALGRQFDLIVMAGNVILFVDADDRPHVARSLANHCHPGSLVISGLQLAREDGRRVPLTEIDSWMASAGFTLAERFGTWDEDAWTTDSDYAVSVHGYSE